MLPDKVFRIEEPELFFRNGNMYRLGGAVAAKSGEERLNVAAATDGKAKALEGLAWLTSAQPVRSTV